MDAWYTCSLPEMCFLPLTRNSSLLKFSPTSRLEVPPVHLSLVYSHSTFSAHFLVNFLYIFLEIVHSNPHTLTQSLAETQKLLME